MDSKRWPDHDASIAPASELDGFSLPGWIYRDPDFLEAEKERVSLRSFARRMRDLIPESRLERAPAPGWPQRHGRISRG
jgi:hypothetical protein